jgi:hypothetical protein
MSYDIKRFADKYNNVWLAGFIGNEWITRASGAGIYASTGNKLAELIANKAGGSRLPDESGVKPESFVRWVAAEEAVPGIDRVAAAKAAAKAAAEAKANKAAPKPEVKPEAKPRSVAQCRAWLQTCLDNAIATIEGKMAGDVQKRIKSVQTAHANYLAACSREKIQPYASFGEAVEALTAAL